MIDLAWILFFALLVLALMHIEYFKHVLYSIPTILSPVFKAIFGFLNI